jgi:hypothetical protein
VNSKNRTFLYVAAGLVVLLIVAAIGVNVYVHGLGPKARQRVIRALQDRFDANVQLKSLDLEIFPHPSITGEGLTIAYRNWPADHPLIAIRRFSADASISDLFWQRDKVSEVNLEGLQIHIPPHGAAKEVMGTGTEQPGADNTTLRIEIEKIVADGTLLEIEPKKAGKDPLQYEIQRLTLYSASADTRMTFRAQLVNAKPPGLINSNGTFGPWQKDEPRTTPVGGKYTFTDADLSVFKGISGMLSSTGSYNGVLEHIEVDGTTDTPNFALKRGGAPVHLKTKFHSTVNGTDGETVLEPVDASFLSSEFICRGGIVKLNGQKAKTVDLDATTRNARMEDILTLVMGDKQPILTGAVDFRSKIVIPPGQEDVLDKLELDGKFKILSAHFTSPKVAQNLDTLSDRARGISKDEQAELPRQEVASNLLGTFRLDRGVASFSHLSFEVPGATIRLAGDYNLRTQSIDMAGVFRMQATLSDTQSGWKALLLKPLDPLFKKNGAGFEVPLKLGGDRHHPEVSVDVFHHTFTLK